MPCYYYYFVRVIGRANFLLRVEVCESTNIRAAELAKAYIGSPNFNIKVATMEDVFGFEYNVVDLTPVIVNLKGN